MGVYKIMEAISKLSPWDTSMIEIIQKEHGGLIEEFGTINQQGKKGLYVIFNFHKQEESKKIKAAFINMDSENPKVFLNVLSGDKE